MLNSKNQSNKVERINGLVKTINEARKALEKWQDHKTEALIEMESLSYDIQIVEEEKARAFEQMENMKAEMKNQQWAYQNHVETLTDQMQMIKFQNEELQGQLQSALDEIHRQQREIEGHKEEQKKIEAGQSTLVAKAKSELEVKISDLQHQHRHQLESMTNKLDSIHAQKSEVESKARKLEADLQVIRTQMLNALRVGEALAASVAMPIPAPPAGAESAAVSTASSGTVTSKPKRIPSAFQDDEPMPIANTTTSNSKERPVFQANSVVEYLKRLGY